MIWTLSFALLTNRPSLLHIIIYEYCMIIHTLTYLIHSIPKKAKAEPEQLVSIYWELFRKYVKDRTLDSVVYCYFCLVGPLLSHRVYIVHAYVLATFLFF